MSIGGTNARSFFLDASASVNFPGSPKSSGSLAQPVLSGEGVSEGPGCRSGAGLRPCQRLGRAGVRRADGAGFLEPMASPLPAGGPRRHPRGRGELRRGAGSGSRAEVTPSLLTFAFAAFKRLALWWATAELKQEQPRRRQRR